jgi:hypothetical protein
MPFVQPRDASGRLVNLDGSGPPRPGAVLRWAVVDRLAWRRRISPDRAPVARVEPDHARLAVPPPPGAPARLTWLGHASFLVQLDGTSLLVDPVLGEAIFGGTRRNVAPGVPVEKLPRVDASLVTHAHYDHLDLPTLSRVRAPVIAGLGSGRYLRGAGPGATELGWWRLTRVGGVQVTFVPAQHWSRRGPFDVNAALWGGFVVEGSSAAIYHAGDTALFDGFREIGVLVGNELQFAWGGDDFRWQSSSPVVHLPGAERDAVVKTRLWVRFEPEWKPSATPDASTYGSGVLTGDLSALR